MKSRVECAHAEVNIFRRGAVDARQRRPRYRIYDVQNYNVRSTSMTFESFYQQEYRAVLGLAYVLVGPYGGAEDLTQEAFTKAHQRWDEIKTYENPQAWIRRVLVNQKNSNFRRLSIERKANAKLGQQRTEVVELSPHSEEVWAAVRALPERQTQVIALRYWNDLTVRQIAETLDCGTETIKTHLSRARATLAQQLDNETSGKRWIDQ